MEKFKYEKKLPNEIHADSLAMVQMPINKLHYTALTQLLRNPLIFKLKYILGVYDSKIGMQGMIGRAGHHALRAYYGGDPDSPLFGEKDAKQALAKEMGLAYIEEFSESYVDYGKTGSKEQLLRQYTQAMDFYFAEEPEYHEILMCEEKLEAEIHTIDGDLLPLPAVGIPDLVHKRKDGGIEIVDAKFVKSFTDWETEDYIKIVQSQFLWHLLKEKGITADRMIFREIKCTENSRDNAGKPQVRDYAIPFSHEQYRIIFYNIYKDVVRFIANPDAVYLPNLSDPFDGERAGLLYAQGLISADMSDVEVMHKVKDVAFQSKKFVPSRLERIENQYLPPEERIKMRLAEFGIPVEPEEVKVGASVTQYRFKVSAGVRMSSFEKHRADIARAIESKGNLRILAPIPGTGLVGVEVANETRVEAKLSKKDLVLGTLSVPVGMNVMGESVKVPLDEMPHLLIAGATGSGKSIFLHSLITALTKQMSPDMMDLILIDPKRVELRSFAKLKHLHGKKVLYEYEDGIRVLMELSDTMEIRYKLLERYGKRDIAEYNKTARTKLAYKVVVIDEFADFMFRSRIEEKKRKGLSYQTHTQAWLAREIKERTGESVGDMKKATIIEALDAIDAEDEMKREDASVELLVVRLAQMARAVGIHLVIATQRPSVDVITGLIKANFPTRIALTTASPADSMVILGEPGAEKLSGKGDLIFMHPGGGKVRLQGFMI
jgi:hypothetical protein